MQEISDINALHISDEDLQKSHQSPKMGFHESQYEYEEFLKQQDDELFGKYNNKMLGMDKNLMQKRKDELERAQHQKS